MATIGLNLYSMREHCKTEEALDLTLARIAAIGYPSVQVSGIPQFTPELVKSLLDRHNLRCCAAHEGMAQLRSDLPGVFRKLTILGTDFTALGMPLLEDLKPGKLEALIAELDTIAASFAAQGLRFGYHNHHVEFERHEGALVLDRIFSGAPHLLAEPDTHWIQRGGGDPVAWIRRLAGRIPALHVKDYVVRGMHPCFAEVGQGNLDWDGILGAAKDAGVDLFIVEQDDPTPDRDMFDSIALSYTFLKAKLG